MGDIELVYIVAFFVVFLLSTTVHEAAHALVGWKLGDDTAYLGGQVSLDPTPHIRREPFGMVVMPLLSLIQFGWPMGFATAPYDPEWAYRYPRRSALMALAGPASNLLLAVLAAIGIRIGLGAGWFESALENGYDPGRLIASVTEGDNVRGSLAMLLSMTFSVNLILCAFNMLPLPPMDGSGALALILPKKLSRRVTDFLQQPHAGLVGMLFAWFLFWDLFGPTYVWAIRLVILDA